MNSIGIPWWGWLSAVCLAITLIAAWQPGPTAVQWLTAIWILVKVLVAWLMILALPLLFGVVTYAADWKVGFLVTALAAGLLAAAILIFSLVNIVFRLLDCLLRCIDTRP